MPKCLSSAALYGESNALQLPFKTLVEEYKVAKVRTSIQFMFSKDPRVTAAGVQVYTGKKMESDCGKKKFMGPWLQAAQA